MSRRTRKPTPPGEVLHEECLSPMELTQKQLADHVGCDVNVINRIVNRCRPPKPLALGRETKVNDEIDGIPAAGYFATGYKNFPESNKASDNLLKLGMSLVNLDETEKACFTFKELAERFPDASSSIKQRASAESQRAGCS